MKTWTGKQDSVTSNGKMQIEIVLKPALRINNNFNKTTRQLFLSSPNSSLCDFLLTSRGSADSLTWDSFTLSERELNIAVTVWCVSNYYYYRPKTKLREGTVFSCVCLSFCLPTGEVPVHGPSPAASPTPPQYMFKLVHYEARTVKRQAVGIQPKCFLENSKSLLFAFTHLQC